MPGCDARRVTATPVRDIEPASPAAPTRRAGAALALLLGFVVLVVLYVVTGRAVAPNSDGASLVLEGQTVGHGHLLLQGWALSLDSFWTSEVPLYALGYLAAGVDPLLLRLVPAVLAALVVVLGVIIAGDGARRRATVAGAVTVVALLAFPTYAFTLYFLRGGSHVGALACSLLAIYAVRRGRWGPGVMVAVLSLTVGMLGDLQALAYGTVPIFVAGLVAMRRTRSWRGGTAQSGAAVGAVIVTVAVRVVTVALGTFTIGSANPIVRNPAHLLRNADTLVHFAGALLGPSTAAFGSGSTPAALQAVHVVGLAVAVAGIVVAAVRLVVGLSPVARGRLSPRRLSHAATREEAPSGDPGWSAASPSWRLDDVLVIAAVTSAGSYVLLATTADTAYARYLTASIVFSSILGGRLVAWLWIHTSKLAALRLLASAGLIVTLVFAAGSGYRLSMPAVPRPAGPLVTWLEAHRLSSGVGAYFSASITTVESHDRVAVRPVITGPAGRLVRYERESTASWYRGHRFDFLVYQPGAPWNDVDERTAAATWGNPAHTYSVDGYAVVVWARPFVVAGGAGP
jgi:hypothetical protein